jgi:hypothetical protein
MAKKVAVPVCAHLGKRCPMLFDERCDPAHTRCRPHVWCSRNGRVFERLVGGVRRVETPEYSPKPQRQIEHFIKGVGSL